MVERMGTLAFNEACQRILADDKTNGYAKAYAKAGLSMLDDREEIRVQSLYILSNITAWRGENATLVRNILKEFAKG